MALNIYIIIYDNMYDLSYLHKTKTDTENNTITKTLPHNINEEEK
jgi:hypothetical protein